MSSSQHLALFDFDGTLIKKDSLFQFLRFFKGIVYFIYKMSLATPMLVLYKIGLISNSKAKEGLFFKFLKGKKVEEFTDRAKVFASYKIPAMLDEKMFKNFQEHLVNGDKVIIVSASITEWIEPWAALWKVEVIATKLERKDGYLTGKILGKNCNGVEKVERINASINLAAFKSITAYGDSAGDEPMFGLADTIVYRGEERT